MLRAVVEALDGEAVRGLIIKAERAQSRLRLPSEAAWAEPASRAGPSGRLAALPVGGPHDIPILAIRPGQTQLSFEHARERMVKLVKAIETERPDELRSLFRPRDFPVVIGPDGGFALLRDGHHKLTAVLALSALVHDVLGTRTRASSRTALGVAKGLKRFAELIPPPDALEIPAWVEGQEASISPGRKASVRIDDFFSLFDDPDRYHPPLYLHLRGGGTATLPPERLSDLEDNPFRQLAADLVAKFEWSGDGTPKFKSAASPLWLKGPDAPPYIEFYVAEVLEAASRDAGFSPEPGLAIPPNVRAAFSRALLEAQHEGHPVLRKIIGFEHETDGQKLRASLELLPHAVLDFGRRGQLAADAIPIALLPSDAPDTHRLHAAARLHDALVHAGAEIGPGALEPEVARAAIERLATVHDDVGLWVNTRALSRREWDRDAALARALGVEVTQHKKTRLEVADPAGPKHPLWVDVAGLPESAPYVIADLLGDLLESVGHDPDRLKEISEEARRRLIDAKTRPDHPAYERFAQIPVVVMGDRESVAASLRVGRKKRILKLGRPVEGDKPQPHVLAPKAHLVVAS